MVGLALSRSDAGDVLEGHRQLMALPPSYLHMHRGALADPRCLLQWMFHFRHRRRPKFALLAKRDVLVPDSRTFAIASLAIHDDALIVVPQPD